EPWQQYHWKVLPQEMKNSPTICQWVVGRILAPIRKRFEDTIILYYIDDILICSKDHETVNRVLEKVLKTVKKEGFEIAEQKIQHIAPWKFLGTEITHHTIKPQLLEIRDDPKTGRELHQLCGSINWVRLLLGISTDDMVPLFNLLKGGGDLDAPKQLTLEAKEAIRQIADALKWRQAHRHSQELPFHLAILGPSPKYYALIFQWDEKLPDPLVVIEWIFRPNQFTKTITTGHDVTSYLIKKARTMLLSLAGCDFDNIFVPFKLFQIALEGCPAQLTRRYPKPKLFKTQFKLYPKRIMSNRPIQGVTIFTDGSGRSHKSVLTWKDPRTQLWKEDVQLVQGSPQIAKIAAVVRAFKMFLEPINIVTDSEYIYGVVSWAEDSILKEVSNPHLFEYLSQLVHLISVREHPFLIMHTRSHTPLPGFIAEGNKRADALAMLAQNHLPNISEQVRLSHQFFHQNASALVRMFKITRNQAISIVSTCPSCQTYALPSTEQGVNPRGLGSLQLWQTDVTHYLPFGKLKYIHVSIDTFSGAMFASAHSGEKAKDVIKHLTLAFSTLVIPKEIKTDNRTAYKSKPVQDFLQLGGVNHPTGIPHSPTGQAIVERSHQSLKQILEQQ
ncbi:POK8 protein, partial [Promerops cafer]|nr:POK8 protein [Promerops cafer]